MFDLLRLVREKVQESATRAHLSNEDRVGTSANDAVTGAGMRLQSWPCGFDSRHPLHLSIARKMSTMTRAGSQTLSSRRHQHAEAGSCHYSSSVKVLASCTKGPVEGERDLVILAAWLA